jgi:hypothetical protein
VLDRPCSCRAPSDCDKGGACNVAKPHVAHPQHHVESNVSRQPPEGAEGAWLLDARSRRRGDVGIDTIPAELCGLPNQMRTGQGLASKRAWLSKRPMLGVSSLRAFAAWSARCRAVGSRSSPGRTASETPPRGAPVGLENDRTKSHSSSRAQSRDVLNATMLGSAVAAQCPQGRARDI